MTSTLQHVRHYYEDPVITTAQEMRIEYRAENALEPGGDALHEWLHSRLQFTQMSTLTVGCSYEDKRGVYIVDYYGQKGIGPDRAQEVLERVICKLQALHIDKEIRYGVRGYLGPIAGPRFDVLEERPYYKGSINMPVWFDCDL